MSRTFVRSEQLKDVVFDVKLRIPEWKILFAVDGAMDSTAIANFLEMPEGDVTTTLEKLTTLNLISVSGNGAVTEAPEVEEEPVVEEVAEEPEIFEEPVEPEPAPEVAEEPEIISAAEDLLPEADSFDDLEETEVDLTDAVDDDSFIDLENEETIMLEDDTSGSEDDFDQLIGNLLEDDNDAPAAEADVAEPEVEAPPAQEDSSNPDFDLGSIFDEEMTETEEALDDMLGALDDEAAAAPAAQSAPPVQDVAEAATTTAETILVVDDSVVIRKMVEIALENENYEIVSVATGKEALSYLDENTPNLIILDIMLSDVNGLDVLKAVKASKDIPVVMLSAKDTPRETTKAKQLGADDFIPKPFKDEELVGKIKELIR